MPIVTIMARRSDVIRAEIEIGAEWGERSEREQRGEAIRVAHSKSIPLSNSNLSGSDLSGSDLSGVPKISNIHQTVYAAASQEGALDIAPWHTCETTHSRAGWVVTLAGAGGAALEYCLGTSAAAALIYQASDPTIGRIPDFFASNKDALADMKRLAEQEAAQ